MKPIHIIGVVLIILGGISLAYQGITYTAQESQIKIGSMEIGVEEKESIPLPPIIGGLCIAGGVILILAGKRSKSS